jgi:RING finger/CHY zinc finger protein 1
MSTDSGNGETDETGDAGEMRKLEDEKYEIENRLENRFNNCGHYVSGCKIVAKCCDKEFGCRFCHDSEISDHQINRYDIAEIVCNGCKTRQPVSNLCMNPDCDNNMNNIEFAKYYCGICHLYSNEPKAEIYHCDKCNICRMCSVGYTRDDYYHCDKCGGCINKSIKDTHKCISEAFNNDCCICLESIFLSRESTIILPCGHIIHSDCYMSSLRQNRYTCPLCRKTMITGDILERVTEEYDRVISTLEYTQNVKVQIICNDCGIKGEVRFHPIGLKCGGCGGYNTSMASNGNGTGTGTGNGNDEQ